jgi:hypothetical protein
MSVFIIFDIQVRIISRLRAIIITSLSIKKVKSKQRAHSVFILRVIPHLDCYYRLIFNGY